MSQALQKETAVIKAVREVEIIMCKIRNTEARGVQGTSVVKTLEKQAIEASKAVCA